LLGLVTAAAADLHRVVCDFPGHFGGPHLAHGGLDAEIAGFFVDHRGGEEGDRFHRKVLPAISAIFPAIG
jgi:hypothetical protein